MSDDEREQRERAESREEQEREGIRFSHFILLGTRRIRNEINYNWKYYSLQTLRAM